MNNDSDSVRVHLCVNGLDHDVLVDPGDRLIDVLRDDLGLTGTKEGCGIGVCGACTVLINGRAENSCLVPAASLDGASVTTIEGLSHRGNLSALQDSFLRHHAVQCGFCTPGLLLSATALLDEDPHPTEARIREALRGNLCRCTGYEQVVEAILDTSGTAVDESPSVVVNRSEGGEER
ncbi:(2Fe-2S)-binding protein [Tractidigestivibacter montrealensis]|uniref:(2Fe-2S)-binding protein n=1 Tax=Tractidigestivibacter montrealensis TaxID=2972466 RepID=A0ABT1Z5Y6_9ACTN|nr:(2Fe-2S)-binding protein [Tractidigestivibacter montrealensis]MCR9035629.1 (2Fe-2S)-binding protein [Tractidigestivibacter montrealensis]